MTTPLALCWGSVNQAGLPELATHAARYGFAEISAKVSHYRKAIAAGYSPLQIREILETSGVRVGVLDPILSALPGVPPLSEIPENLRDGFDYSLEECLDVGLQLGVRTLNVAHFLGRPTDLSEMADALAGVADAAAQVGIRVSVEFIAGTGIPDLATARELCRRSKAPNVGVLFDTWHFARSEGKPSDLADLAPDEIFEVQLSDRRPPPPGEAYVPMTGRLIPGDGELPLIEIVRTLRNLSPDLVFGVEVFTAEEHDPDQRIPVLASAMRALLEKAERS